jgi:hypothetical protein
MAFPVFHTLSERLNRHTVLCSSLSLIDSVGNTLCCSKTFQELVIVGIFLLGRSLDEGLEQKRVFTYPLNRLDEKSRELRSAVDH